MSKANKRRRHLRVRRIAAGDMGPTRHRGAERYCVVLLPTYDRPDLCARLLSDLAAQRKHFDDLVVLDDASPSDYSAVRQLVGELGGQYLRARKNRGKRGYRDTVNRLLREAKERGATEIVFLADDMRLCKGFFVRARETWDAIRDPRKVLLNLHLDRNRVGKACWTKIVPHARAGGICSGWTDGIWFATGRLFHALPEVPQISSDRWKGEGIAQLSSGVWQVVSQRLVNEGWHIYQTKKSLTVHVAAPSAMNQNRRVHISIPTHDFVDGPQRARTLALGAGPVIASMATIPDRQKQLRKTVASLVKQVDQLVIYLNYGSETTPGFLSHPKITTYRSDASGFGDLSDMGKFYPSNELRNAGYLLTVDDDLVYAPDYVDRLLHFVEIHKKRAAVGYHGVELLDGAPTNYYKRRKVHHCRHPVRESTWVHVLGTGVLAFARDLLELPTKKEQLVTGRGMADVWFGALAQEQRIPLRAIAHSGREIEQQQLPAGATLYARMKRKAGVHRDLLEQHWPWSLHTIEAA